MTADNANLHLVMHMTAEAEGHELCRAISDSLPDSFASVHLNLAEAVAAYPEAPLVVLVETPARNIARRLDLGSDAEAALKEWQASIQTLMQTCRKARRHILLLAWDELMAGQTESVDALRQKAGESASALSLVLQEFCPSDPAAISVVLAGVLLMQDDPSRKLLHEIEAMLAGPAMATGLNSETVLTALAHMRRGAQAEAGLQSDLTRLEQERSLLQQNLSAQQNTLTAFEDRSDVTHAQGERLAMLQQHVADLTSEGDLLRESLRELQNLNAELLTGNQHANDQLVGLHMIRASKEALEHRCQELDRLRLLGQSALGAVLLDDSARLRQADSRVAMLADQLRDAEQDRRIVSDEMKSLDAQHKETARLLTETETALAALKAELARTLDEQAQTVQTVQNQQILQNQQAEALAEMAAQLREQDAQNTYLSAELDKVYGSRSWRLTAPMRNARSRFTKGTP